MGLAQRRSRVLRAARALGAEAMVVTHLADIRYLSGFTGSSAALLLGSGRARLFTDGRYREQVQAEVKGVSIAIEARSPLQAAIEWAVENGVTHCAFDAGHTTVTQFEAMQRLLPAKSRRGFLRSSESLVATVREVKDAEEIERMRAAARLGCELFAGVLNLLEPGVPENVVAAWLETEARRRGADAMSFETIVASGERSALPHGRATAAKLPRRGFVTLDFGVVLQGYCSDMTRTVHMGRAGSDARRVYDSVLEAQETALAAVRPGAEAGAVDEAARSVLRAAGLGECFVHSTGHGVGLEIHEAPRLAAKQKEQLKAGMIVTIEPGVYRAGKFGVRIEDMVLVVPRGGEVITPSPKVLIEL